MARLPLMGGCMCGALRYEVSAPPLMIYNCHCTNCQKISGSAFNISVIVFGGVAVVHRGRAGACGVGVGRGVDAHADCSVAHAAAGSRMEASPSTGVLSLRAGTLDDTSWVQPVGDTCTSSAQPWVRFVEGGLRAEKQPADYAPFVAAFRAQGRF